MTLPCFTPMSPLDTAFQRCLNPACRATFSVTEVLTRCTSCGELLDVDYDWDRVRVPRSLREFEARVTLYADIARQREDFDQQLKSANAEDHRRAAALSAENQRLKKSLAEAERKLSAVAGG